MNIQTTYFYSISDFICENIIREIEWPFSFGDAAFTLVEARTVKATLAESGVEIPARLLDLHPNRLISFKG